MEEKKLVSAYVVKHYDNGDTDVEDAHLEGTTEMSSDEIFRDIETTAKAVELKRVENAAYMGVMRFYDDVGRRAAAAQAEAEAAAAPAEEAPKADK